MGLGFSGAPWVAPAPPDPDVLAVDAGADAEYVAGEHQLAAPGATGGVPPYVYLWTVLAGGSGSFDDDGDPNAVFTPDDPLVHSDLQLQVTDADLDIAVDALRVCAPLVVSAGPDAASDDTHQLAGSVTGGVPPYAILWTHEAGGGTAAFDDDEDPTSEATFDASAAYGLRLTATDARAVSDQDDVTITATIPVGADPYVLFPSLDLATIPWHVGAGGWGDQIEIQQPTLPTTSRQVSVDTWAEFQAESGTPETEITVTASIAGLLTVSADDVEVIGAPGVVLETILLQGVQRFYIHGGLQVGQVRTQFAGNTDLVFDDIDLNGDGDAFGPGETHQCFRLGEDGAPAVRIAVLNCRGIAAGYFWGGNGEHVVVAGTSFYHGAAARADVGFGEGWGFRNAGGPVVFWQCDVRGTRYVNIRTHSLDGPGEGLYIGQCTLVATAEGRSCWAWPNLGNNAGIGAGFIIEDCDVYAYAVGGACSLGPEFSTYQCQYSRGRRNNFFGAGHVVWNQTYLDSLETGGGGTPPDHDWGADQLNTFDTYVAEPAWGAAGDPTGIAMPGGLALITGELDCPGGP